MNQLYYGDNLHVLREHLAGVRAAARKLLASANPPARGGQEFANFIII